MSFATGVLRLEPDKFWKLTWAEYDIMCEGYAKEQTQKYREKWELVRWQTFHLFRIQLDKKGQRKYQRLTDLIRFSWDEKRDYEPSTRERFDELCKLWGKTIC